MGLSRLAELDAAIEAEWAHVPVEDRPFTWKAGTPPPKTNREHLFEHRAAEMRERQASRARKAVAAPAAVFEVIERIAKSNDLTVDDLLTGPKFKHVTPARQEMFVTLRAMGFSFLAIARWTGFHHTTAVYYVQTAEPDSVKATRQRVLYEIQVPDESGVWAI